MPTPQEWLDREMLQELTARRESLKQRKAEILRAVEEVDDIDAKIAILAPQIDALTVKLAPKKAAAVAQPKVG